MKNTERHTSKLAEVHLSTIKPFIGPRNNSAADQRPLKGLPKVHCPDHGQEILWMSALDNFRGGYYILHDPFPTSSPTALV